MQSIYQSHKFAPVATTTTEVIANTADFQHFMFTVHSVGTTTGSVRFKASFTEDVPNFEAAASATNSWEYVAIRELSSGNLIAGATGAAVSASTINKNYEAELNGAHHIAFEITVSGGQLGVNAFLRNN